MKSKYLFIILLLLNINVSVSDGKTVIEDTVNIVVDPLGVKDASENILESIDKLTQSLDRSLIQLNDLQRKTDKDIREYLDQIRNMSMKMRHLS